MGHKAPALPSIYKEARPTAES